MVYLVMASQFESLLHPFVILFSVPFALIGVLGTLYVFGVTISIVVLIGTILLAGIVVNNAIILVDYTNQLRRKGKSKLDALRQAGAVRLRPILMTTATTVLGLLPMAIGLGAGSELRRPMALTVIGGLITSTALTLLIIPRRLPACSTAASNLQLPRSGRSGCRRGDTMKDFHGKRVLVTGGGQGIGLEMAIKFAERGRRDRHRRS